MQLFVSMCRRLNKELFYLSNLPLSSDLKSDKTNQNVNQLKLGDRQLFGNQILRPKLTKCGVLRQSLGQHPIQSILPIMVN